MTGVLTGWSSDTPLGGNWVVLVTFLYVLSFLLGPGPLAQLPTTFIFLFTCPGALLIDWLRFPTRAMLMAITLTVSLAANILIATILVGTTSYSPLSGLIATAAVSMTGAIISILKNQEEAALLSPESPFFSG